MADPLKVTIYFLGVKICFLGEAYVTWTESNRSSTGASRRRFRGIEEYYKFSYYLMGSDSGKYPSIFCAMMEVI